MGCQKILKDKVHIADSGLILMLHPIKDSCGKVYKIHHSSQIRFMIIRHKGTSIL